MGSCVTYPLILLWVSEVCGRKTVIFAIPSGNFLLYSSPDAKPVNFGSPGPFFLRLGTQVFGGEDLKEGDPHFQRDHYFLALEG